LNAPIIQVAEKSANPVSMRIGITITQAGRKWNTGFDNSATLGLHCDLFLGFGAGAVITLGNRAIPVTDDLGMESVPADDLKAFVTQALLHVVAVSTAWALAHRA
jgi:hypothetical protein